MDHLNAMLSKRRGKPKMSNNKKLPSRERSYPWRKVLGPLTDVKRIVERNRFGFQLIPREDFKSRFPLEHEKKK